MSRLQREIKTAPPKRTPKSRPAARQTLKELQHLQRLAASVIMRRLGPGMQTNRTWKDGNLTADLASTFIKPNDRLTSLDRIEIYNKQYWFRLVDCMYEDYPGLLAVLGQRKFEKLIYAYLENYPSRSFTLRNLGDRLEQFIIEQPELAEPKRQLAQEMAAFEWAQVVAFDGPEFPPLDVDDLLGKNPAKLRMAVQPYVTILELNYPLDDFTMGLKKQQTALRSEASNAVESAPAQQVNTKVKPPRRQRLFIAVHRHENDLYFKRMEREQYLLLVKLRDGLTVQRACEESLQFADPKVDWSAKIQAWFKSWTELGWFCKPLPRTGR